MDLKFLLANDTNNNGPFRFDYFLAFYKYLLYLVASRESYSSSNTLQPVNFLSQQPLSSHPHLKKKNVMSVLELLQIWKNNLYLQNKYPQIYECRIHL